MGRPPAQLVKKRIKGHSESLVGLLTTRIDRLMYNFPFVFEERSQLLNMPKYKYLVPSTSMLQLQITELGSSTSTGTIITKYCVYVF